MADKDEMMIVMVIIVLIH